MDTSSSSHTVFYELNGTQYSYAGTNEKSLASLPFDPTFVTISSCIA